MRPTTILLCNSHVRRIRNLHSFDLLSFCHPIHESACALLTNERFTSFDLIHNFIDFYFVNPLQLGSKIIARNFVVAVAGVCCCADCFIVFNFNRDFDRSFW